MAAAHWQEQTLKQWMRIKTINISAFSDSGKSWDGVITEAFHAFIFRNMHHFRNKRLMKIL